MSIDLSSYLNLFADEARDHLKSLNTNLLQLEINPNNHEIINAIFRSAHTLKGMSATMGFNEVAELTHHMENMLDQFRTDKQKLTSAHIELLFQCLDALQVMIECAISGEPSTTQITELVTKLAAVSQMDVTTSVRSIKPTNYTSYNSWDSKELSIELNANKSMRPKATGEFPRALTVEENMLLLDAPARETAYVVHIELNPECLLKSVRIFMVKQELSMFGQLLAQEPDPDTIDTERFGNDCYFLLLADKSLDNLSENIMSISEVNQIGIQPYQSKSLIIDDIEPNQTEPLVSNKVITTKTTECNRNDIEAHSAVCP